MQVLLVYHSLCDLNANVELGCDMGFLLIFNPVLLQISSYLTPCLETASSIFVYVFRFCYD
ncbi:hypothetical protein [Campylobacter coli]|uniref:hypothetical protein n=1 Tax=Campylobacter coli TaxID=195 RepID=UPI001F09E296|nr:hypothetical protein [Campylobacter coli]MCH3754022.1 hypothetical protein [Campylobacter coli]